MPRINAEAEKSMSAIGEKIRKLRLNREISQQVLASHLGIDRKTLAKCELRGRGHLSQFFFGLLAMCQVLDISPNDLLGWENSAQVAEIPMTIVALESIILLAKDALQNGGGHKHG